MPHVSKEPLEKELYDKLFLELQKAIVKSNKQSANIFMYSVLTETERTMITKRFSTILLLSQGLSNYEISNQLKLSSSTVARIKLLYEKGKYNKLLKLIKGKEKIQFMNILEILLNGGLPSRAAERWKHVSGLGAKN